MSSFSKESETQTPSTPTNQGNLVGALLIILVFLLIVWGLTEWTGIGPNNPTT